MFLITKNKNLKMTYQEQTFGHYRNDLYGQGGFSFIKKASKKAAKAAKKGASLVSDETKQKGLNIGKNQLKRSPIGNHLAKLGIL